MIFTQQPIAIPTVTNTKPSRNIFTENNFIDEAATPDEDLQQPLMRGSRRDPKQKPREQKMGLIVFCSVVFIKHNLEDLMKIF